MKRAIAALACLCVCASCVNFTTQRWPKPMRAAGRDLPPGDQALHPAGPEEVTLLRHADPVSYRPAETLSGIPMAFYDKTRRLTAGGSVVVAPGGLAEIVWPDGSSISLSSYGIGWVTSPSRGEPLFEFQEVTRARISLRKAGAVRLVGGAILRGASGPYHLERQVDDTLRVHNQSKGLLFVEFREAQFELGPGQALDLPLLGVGGAPVDSEAGFRRASTPIALDLRGDLQVLEDPNGSIVVRSGIAPDEPGLEGLQDEREIRTQGVRIRLEAGEQARLKPFLGRGAAGANAPASVPSIAPIPEPSPATGSQPTLPASPSNEKSANEKTAAPGELQAPLPAPQTSKPELLGATPPKHR